MSKREEFREFIERVQTFAAACSVNGTDVTINVWLNPNNRDVNPPDFKAVYTQDSAVWTNKAGETVEPDAVPMDVLTAGMVTACETLRRMG